MRGIRIYSNYGESTYQTITLATIHHAVKDIQNPEPKRKHAGPVGKLIKEAQEDLADQRGGLEPCLAHANGVRVIDLRLQKEDDKRE